MVRDATGVTRRTRRERTCATRLRHAAAWAARWATCWATCWTWDGHGATRKARQRVSASHCVDNNKLHRNVTARKTPHEAVPWLPFLKLMVV